MLKEFTAISELSNDWESLLMKSDINTIFTNPHWSQLWWDHFAEGKQWKGLYLESNSNIVGIAPMCVEQDTLKLIGNTETVDYNDFIVNPEFTENFFNLIIEYFLANSFNALHLDSIQEKSLTYQRLPFIARENGLNVVVTVEDVSPGIQLPKSWDSYLSSLNKKHRHELRRKLRRLDATDNYKVEIIDQHDNLEQYMNTFNSLMKMSRVEKMEYLTPEKEHFFNDLSSITSQQGFLKLFLLSMDNQYVSASLCFDYDNQRLLYNSGNNHEFDYYSVGLLLHSFAIKDAIEHNLHYFDFLRGDEQYKYRLGGIDNTVYSIQVTK
tara:strand:- start:8513 stop:9484 length:972 start_codon:yes stop_codon:yes gene_type:complete